MTANPKTKILIYLSIFVSVLFVSNVLCQNPMDSTVMDFDGNVYQTVTIGSQVWLKENLKSFHYADGAPIPGVIAYNNSDSLAQIYGRLYTWNAAMRDSSGSNVRGVCPCEWHMPTNAEWQELADYLGGVAVAGGKMKEAGTTHWSNPNTGATNSSGFTALAAGEWDLYNATPFRLMNEYAVFWTATSVNGSKARERYLAYNNSELTTFDWYKALKYSIRCVKNQPTTKIGLEQRHSTFPKYFSLKKNYPNPFNPSTNITYKTTKNMFINLTIYDVRGMRIQTLVNQKQNPGEYVVTFFAHNLPSGIYYYQFEADGIKEIGQMLLLK